MSLNPSVAAVLEWAGGAGPWAPAAVGAVFVVATLFLVPFWMLASGAGFVLGGPAGAAVSFAANSLGGAVAFGLARTRLRGPVERAIARHPRLAAVAGAVAAAGFRVVLLTRLSPVYPSNLLNYAFGATAVRFRDFLAASAIGMLPTLTLYTYLGTAARSLAAAPMRGVEQAYLAGDLVVTVAATAYLARLALKAVTRVRAAGTPDPTGRR